MSSAAKPVVLITARLVPENLAYARERLERIATIDYQPAHPGWEPARLHELIRDADAVIAGGDRYDEAAFAAARRLKVVARIGVGYDQVDLAAARAHGIDVTTTPGVNADSVADLATGLIIALVRGLVSYAANLQAGRWQPDIRRDVSDLSLGLVGFGAIGSRVARRALALNMRVAAVDPRFSDAELLGAGVTPLTHDALYAASDILSLHLPLVAATRQMVNADVIWRMPRGAYLVNTARGGLVDEAAVLDALDRGHLAGVATDVFQTEPATGISMTLAQHPSVIATPHIAASTVGSLRRSIEQSVESVLAALEGREIPRIINPAPPA